MVRNDRKKCFRELRKSRYSREKSEISVFVGEISCTFPCVCCLVRHQLSVLVWGSTVVHLALTYGLFSSEPNEVIVLVEQS